MTRQRSILLSFDVEEFDMPLEYGHAIPAEEQLKAGYEGLIRIKKLLSELDVPVTFFTTANFANHFPEIIRELSLTHEIASHTYYHSSFETNHLQESKVVLEKITGKPVMGLRMPRMKKVSMDLVAAAGYTYDSSLNPTWLPGRYNHFNKPRTIFIAGRVKQVPASVSTFLRIPLFWLSFKNLSYPLYRGLVLKALKKDGYVCLYFHPWEFIDLGKYAMPGYTRKPDNTVLLKKLERLIIDLKKEGDFTRMDSFTENYFIKK